MSQHVGYPLPTQDKVALANEMEAVVKAAIAPFIAAQAAQNACPCCISRAVAGALVKLMGYHAAAGISTPDDLHAFVSMVAAAVALGQAQIKAEQAGVEDDDLYHMAVSGRPS